MLIRIIFIFCTFLYAKEDWFITNYEYGKMLYNNPRGISCAKCHGKRGEGKIITSFINSNNQKVIIKTSPFKYLTFEKLKSVLYKEKKLFKKKPKFLNIMPKYDYLTDNEIKAILLYLRKENDF